MELYNYRTIELNYKTIKLLSIIWHALGQRPGGFFLFFFGLLGLLLGPLGVQKQAQEQPKTAEKEFKRTKKSNRNCKTKKEEKEQRREEKKREEQSRAEKRRPEKRREEKRQKKSRFRRSWGVFKTWINPLIWATSGHFFGAIPTWLWFFNLLLWIPEHDSIRQPPWYGRFTPFFCRQTMSSTF